MWGCVRWDAVGRSVPSQAALPRPIPRHPRHRTCPRSPRSASVLRKLISEADPPSYPTSRGPTTPMGTNHDGHYREPRPRRQQRPRRRRGRNNLGPTAARDGQPGPPQPAQAESPPAWLPAVPRERLGPPRVDSAAKFALVPNLQGTNQPRRVRR